MSIMDRPPEWRQWYGRRVFLAEKQNFFRCGGCYLTRHNPVHIISEETQINKIMEAVDSGILIDITDNPKGLRIGGIGHTPTKMENTGKKIYITTDRNGGMAIKSAETPEEIDKCDAQIKKTGIIVPHEYRIAEALGVEGRIGPEHMGLVLHNLEEKVANANHKIFGDTPTIKPGPHKVT